MIVNLYSVTDRGQITHQLDDMQKLVHRGNKLDFRQKSRNHNSINVLEKIIYDIKSM